MGEEALDSPACRGPSLRLVFDFVHAGTSCRQKKNKEVLVQSIRIVNSETQEQLNIAESKIIFSSSWESLKDT